MLRWRLILGTIIIASLVMLFRLDYQAVRPGSWLFPLALIASLLGAGEMIRLLSSKQVSPVAWVVYLGTFAVVFCSGVPILWKLEPDCPVGPLGWPLLGLALAVLLAFLGEMKRYEQPGQTIEGLSRSIFAVVYVGLLLSFAVQLRLVGLGPTGFWAVVSLIAVVKMSDIGAYTVGRLVGRTKLAPKLSPGKTWEGLLGGVLFACATSWVIFKWWLPEYAASTEYSDSTLTSSPPVWGWLVYGVAIAVAGVIGDLSESLLKRDAGVKDSSSWMPGFGGVLDLLDSILAAAPVAYVCWVVGLVGF